MSSLFESVQPGFLSGLTSSGPALDKRRFLLYGLGVLIVILAILMVLQVRFNMFPSYLDPRPLRNKVESQSLLYWSPSPSADRYSLEVPKDAMANPKYDRYTISTEMVWTNTRTMNANGPYRHILHRGSDELKALRNDMETLFVQSTMFGGSGSGSAPPGTVMRPLPKFGLPKRLNPGIFADPATNDMLVFVDTQTDGNVFLRESVRVVDIPLDQPFRVAVVVMDKYVEVYINCRLEVTKVLEGRPISVENAWYGLSGSAALRARLQNLKYWGRGLSATELATLCVTPIDFSDLGTCPEDGAPTFVGTAAAGAAAGAAGTANSG